MASGVRTAAAPRAARRWAIFGITASAGLFAALADSSSTPFKDRLEELRRERAKSAASTPRDQGAAPDGAAYIDELLAVEWKQQGLTPAEECTEGEFLRRASLDLIGRVPTLAETREYLSDPSKDRRRKLIDRLLASTEYGANFANVWTKLLIPRDLMGQEADRDALHAWLEREFNRNRPWNEMVFELLTATGRWDENPAVNFILAHQDGESTVRVTANLTRLFLGVQTQCTECHDHPWNDWKQDQFHGLNAFFVGTEKRRATTGAGGRRTEYWELDERPYRESRAKGVFFERRNGLSAFTEPVYLDGRDLAALTGDARPPADEVLAVLGKSPEEDSPVLLRRVLAQTITAPDNPYFAKAAVNRMWRHFFGHSFTKDVDDLDNGLDEPTNPELLDRLADDFYANGCDLKRLARWITTSKAYGLSSRRRGKSTEEAVGFFAFQLVRPLTPEQLYDSVRTVTAIDRTSKSADAASERAEFVRRFLETFGEDEPQTGAPRFDGTVTQGLMMMNSPVMDRATSCSPGSFLHSLASREKATDRERVEEIYLAALCRRPTSAEWKLISRMLADAGGRDDRIALYSDVLWAVLNSAEFCLNH
jgi:hypothetical protein